MKKIIFFSLIFILISIVVFAADPAEGFWLSIDEKSGKATGGWEIFVRNNVLYGRVLSIADYPQDAIAVNCRESYRGFPVPGKVNEMPVVGTTWIYGLTSDKPGVWTGGNVLDAEKGNLYRAKITFRAADGNKFKADTLEMRGEIGLGIGRSQYWRKATREEASSIR